ncbi:MAG TPA: FAD-binding oxidoreductase [Gemmatimonadaceae bacterium]|nr:FAD-binding oxidoreductase [Gemmatimonadaceae bacterium]
MSTTSGLAAPADFRGTFRVDDEARAVYSEAAGIGRILPRAAAVPVDVDDLSLLARWATETRTPLLPRGSGSSMPGGAIGDGVIVDLSRWRTMGDVDSQAGTIRVGPGVLRAEVESVARAKGLRFPVDPSSGAFCTIGGIASTNAAGSHSMRFGSARRWVRALDCVFADGSRATFRRGSPAPRGIPAVERLVAAMPMLVKRERISPSVHAGVRKDSSGYDTAGYAQSGEIVDLLVGSEGTLAFFTAVELDLTAAAAATSSVLGAFQSIDEAVAAAGMAREFGAAACELLDRTFLDVAASGGAERRVPEGTESALLAEVEGESEAAASETARALAEIFRRAGATAVRIALDAAAETELWELRHAASPILARLDPNLRSMQFIEDTAVPPERLADYVRGVRRILEAHETRGVIFGHAGDAHVHVNPLVDVGRTRWRDRLAAILEEITALTASLGGTLTGEHGDGRLRTPLMPRVWPASALASFAEVKRAFDPAGILNPGVKVATVGEQPLGTIKYDPALEPLPPRAAAALARVERDRAYASFRLDLLDAAP